MGGCSQADANANVDEDAEESHSNCRKHKEPDGRTGEVADTMHFLQTANHLVLVAVDQKIHQAVVGLHEVDLREMGPREVVLWIEVEVRGSHEEVLQVEVGRLDLVVDPLEVALHGMAPVLRVDQVEAGHSEEELASFCLTAMVPVGNRAA